MDDILELVFKNIKLFIYAFVISAIVGIVTSLIITPQYTSKMRLNPSTIETASNVIYNTQQSTKEGSLELLLEVFASKDIFIAINNKLNLIEYYEIEDDEYALENAYSVFQGRIKVTRTSFGSIIIEATDKSKERALQLVTMVADEGTNLLNNNMQGKAKDAIAIIDNRLVKVVDDLKLVKEEIDSFQKQGLYDYTTQIEYLNKEYSKALSNEKSTIKNIEKEIQKVSSLQFSFDNLQKQWASLSGEKVDLILTKSKYEIDSEAYLKYFTVIESPTLPQLKSSPNRKLITLFTITLVLISTLLGLLFYNKVRPFITRLKATNEIVK